MQLRKKHFAILCVDLRDAVVQPVPQPHLKKLYWRVLPDQAVANLVVLADIVVRIKVVVAEFQIILITYRPVRFQ